MPISISMIFIATFVVHVVCASPLTNEIPANSNVGTQRSEVSTIVESNSNIVSHTSTNAPESFESLMARKLQEIELSDVAGTDWIDQKLDHFNDTDTRTWRMRYMYNGEYYRNNKVLIFLSSTYYIDYFLLKFGPLIIEAKEMGAYLILLEGRFFGESLPTDDLTLESLQYASTDQVLADIKVSVETIIEKFSFQKDNITIMAIRKSAAIAAWFQLIYPGLVNHVEAHSPLLLAKTEYPEYYEFIGTILKDVGGESCYNNVSKIFDNYHSLIIDRNDLELKRLLNICDNFNISNGYDVDTLFTQIANNFSNYHWHDKVCRKLEKADNLVELVSRFSKLIVTDMKKRHKRNCTDYTYATKYDEMRRTSLESISRVWLYRKCTEYGRFPTFDSLQQPFGNRSLTVTPNPCEYVFGDNFTLDRLAIGVKRTNKKFGGNRLITNVTYIFFGQRDLMKHIYSIPN